MKSQIIILALAILISSVGLLLNHALDINWFKKLIFPEYYYLVIGVGELDSGLQISRDSKEFEAVMQECPETFRIAVESYATDIRGLNTGGQSIEGRTFTRVVAQLSDGQWLNPQECFLEELVRRSAELEKEIRSGILLRIGVILFLLGWVIELIKQILMMRRKNTAPPQQ